MKFSRQVKWGATYIFKWEEGIVARQGILRNSIHYDCFDVENRNGYIMKALARMGNLLKDDLNMKVVDEKRVNEIQTLKIGTY